MKQIRISTLTACGSLANPYDFDQPRALKPPRRIFKRSGLCEVRTSLAIDTEDLNYEGCAVEYHNYSRPKRRAPRL